MENELILKGEITNSCTCTVYDAVKDEYTDIPSDECNGWCWDDQYEMFANDVAPFIEGCETGLFRIENFPVWDGTVNGYFDAGTTHMFLQAVTVRGDWTLRYEVSPTSFSAYLSHHDASGTITVKHVSEEEREEKGLY